VDEKHELQRLIDHLNERDKNMLEEMNWMFGGGPTIDNRLALANARATDALAGLCFLARYIMDREQKVGADKTANAELTGPRVGHRSNE